MSNPYPEYKRNTITLPVYDRPAQQEPVAWMHEWEDGERIPMLMGRDDRNNDQPKSVRPLVYADTSPPAQRKPLRGERFVEIARAIAPRTVLGLQETIPLWIVKYGRAIEAAHGIKGDT